MELRTATLLSLAASAIALASPPATSPSPTALQESGQARMRGFSARSAADQRAIEAKVLEIPKAEQCRQFLRVLTEDPHPAGSEQGKVLADYVRSRLLEYGFNAELVSYEVLLNTPKKIEVTMVEPQEVKAKLKEAGHAWDKDSFTNAALPHFHGYSPSGTVTADLVYANYGMPEDYERLRELGVDVREKVVIVRYGKCYRGVKVREAEERRAKAVIIYSDPADDGYVKGDVFPRGPWRPESAVQRGSVGYMFIAPGDPLSPGWHSSKGSRRIEQAAVTGVGTPGAVLPGIPSVPLSYEDAKPLLESLSGANVPEGWQGGLPFAYHTGPGPARVRVQVEVEWENKLIHNVIARWTGTQNPDEWIVVGNHRDAWVHGAVDPNSGTASLLEAARALGKLKDQGFRPKRSIVFCSWDAEEYGLVGSTEWCEELAAELGKKAVAYVNVDSGVSGANFYASAAPSLARIVREVTSAVEAPRERRSVLDVWSERDRARKAPAEPGYAGGDGEAPRVSDLGSGSDYTAFQHHLGIPSIDLGFGGPYGVYHSVLDDFFWMERFGDPGFESHRALARVLSVLLLRFSQADLLPIRPSATGAAILGHLDDLLRKDAQARPAEKPNEERRKAVDDLKAAAQRLISAANAMESDAERALEAADTGVLDSVNSRLLRFERELLSKEGLLGRPFYRHLYAAPGLHAGYAALMLPGLHESLFEAPRDEAKFLAEARRLTERVAAAAELLESKGAAK